MTQTSEVPNDRVCRERPGDMRSLERVIRVLSLAAVCWVLPTAALGQDAARGSRQRLSEVERSVQEINKDLEEMKEELKKIKEEMRAVTKASDKVDAIKESLDLWEVIVGVFVAIISIAGTVVYIDGRSGRVRMENEIVKSREWYEDFAKTHQESTLAFMDSTKKNVDQASNLFAAFKGVVEFQDKVQQIEDDLRTKEEQTRLRVLKDLNQEAIRVFDLVEYSNYASIEQQEAFERFKSKLDQRSAEYSIQENELTAACFIIYGLDLKVRNTRQRRELLEKAAMIAKRDYAGDVPPQVKEEFEPGELQAWTRRCANQVAHYLAVFLSNLGEYRSSIDWFQQAVDFDESDIRSRIYIPEAKFLGFLEVDFGKIVTEFEILAKDIEEGRTASQLSEEQRKAELASLYVRLGNCYFRRSSFEPYTKHRSLRDSLKHFRKAQELDSESYWASFSYAQALLSWANKVQATHPDHRKLLSQSQELFQKVSSKAPDELARTSEPKARLTIHYMLAICAKEGGVTSEVPQPYIRRIYEQKANLGSAGSLRLYSPLTKNELSVTDFFAEVEEFQRSL